MKATTLLQRHRERPVTSTPVQAAYGHYNLREGIDPLSTFDAYARVALEEIDVKIEAFDDYINVFDKASDATLESVSSSLWYKSMAFKPCLHYKKESSMSGFPEQEYWHRYFWTFRNTVYSAGQYCSTYPLRWETYVDHAKSAVIPLDAQDQALRDALVDVQPSIDDYVATMNLYNVILEMAQVTKLVSLGADLAKKLTIDRATTAYIGTSFGILPLINDIVTVHEIFTKLNFVIDQWNELADAKTILNEHRTVYSVDEHVDFDMDWFEDSRADHYRFQVAGSAKVTSKSKIHLYFRAIRISEEQRYDAFYKAFGLDKPLTGIWDSIPFSWAIDYFTNISEMVANLDFDINNMFMFEFVDAGYSISDLTEVVAGPQTVTTDIYGNEPLYTFKPGLACETKIDRYERFKLDSNVFEAALKKSDLEFTIRTDISTRQTSYLVGVGRIITRKGS